MTDQRPPNDTEDCRWCGGTGMEYYRNMNNQHQRSMINWFNAETATKADVPGYWCLGFNPQWSDPQVRVGAYCIFDRRHGKKQFRLIGGPYMEIAPTLVAPLPCPNGNTDDD